MNKNEDFHSETTWIDPVSMAYHLKQWDEPKRSTVAFQDFFREEIEESKFILDIGAGAGAATSYIASKNPKTKIKGIDISPELIDIANSTLLAQKFNLDQVSFEVGDWFDLKPATEEVDGVISLQTISWVSELKKPLEQIFMRIKPKWIGMSGLFFDGDISCKTEVFEHVKNRKVFYNTYSIEELKRISSKFGFEVAKAQSFQIDIDIPKPANKDILSTYTKTTTEEKIERLQISGPLLLNWYFVLLKRVNS
jgi:cyclopropane fatty-acyl-phospholipid synthase-like methyltransferase